jgi:hypothetical protein
LVPGCALPRPSIQLIHEVSYLHANSDYHISWLCYPCASIALPQACFNCELTVWPVGFVESGSQRANSPDPPCHIYGYNINEICGHYSMNYVGLISSSSVCKDRLLRCSGEKCEQSKQSCGHGEWRTIPLCTKILYSPHFSVPFYSILFVCVAFGIFYLSLTLLQSCCGCLRFLRQPLPSISPQHQRNRAWLVPQFENLPCYFLHPAFTRISANHAVVDMLSVASRPRFGYYSPVRTSSVERVPGGKVASGGKAASSGKVGR